MIESVCRAQALVAVMAECDRGGWFEHGKARALWFRERVETCAAYMIDRIRDAEALPGEVLEKFSTIRGLAQVLGCGKSAAHALMVRMTSLEFFKHRPHIRRWESNTVSLTPGSNAYWWKPTIWRIGPALANFFSAVSRSGTELAASPIENHYRTRVSSKDSGSSSEIFSLDSQQDQRFTGSSPTCPVLIKPIEIEHLIGAADRLSAKLDVEFHRPVTINEAQEAHSDITKAIEAIGLPETPAGNERLQRALKALAQADEFVTLAKLAESMRRPMSLPPITPKGPGYR